MSDESLIRAKIEEITGIGRLDLIWRNELGGTTWYANDVFVKWNPVTSGIELVREVKRLRWLEGRHPAPVVVDFGRTRDAEWLITAALTGESAVAPRWKERPFEAVNAIADGLRALHTIDTESFPTEWSSESWVNCDPGKTLMPPSADVEVLVHGDACSPNTIVSSEGHWVGNVDFVDMAVGDRWADLAVASMALEWNYGPGFEGVFFDAYGIERDNDRIEYYRRLWHEES